MLLDGAVLAHRHDVGFSEGFLVDRVPIELIEIMIGWALLGHLIIVVISCMVLSERCMIVRILILGVPLLLFAIRVKVAAITGTEIRLIDLVITTVLVSMVGAIESTLAMMVVPFAEVVLCWQNHMRAVIEFSLVVDNWLLNGVLRPVKLFVVATVRIRPFKLL